jgi:hypothetical protein
MKPLSRVLIGVILLVILASAPSIEGKITGKHNQAATGCTCHYSGTGITAILSISDLPEEPLHLWVVFLFKLTKEPSPTQVLWFR